MDSSKVSDTSFSRKRKFSFKDLVVNILGFTRTSVRTELDRFFKSISGNPSNITTLTKSAFTQARQKLKPECFVELRDIQLEYFQNNAAFKHNWKGKRVVAIDGSSLILPNEPFLKAKFGTFSNKAEAVSTGAKVSVAYDVCNQLILDAQIDDTQGDEKEMAKSHLSKLCAQTDVLVFDRGYPCIWLMSMLTEMGFSFCFRLSTSWKKAHEAMKNGTVNDIDWSAKKRPSQGYGKLKTYNLPCEVHGLRLVSIDLPSGEKELLVTNLSDRETYPIEAIKELYHLRWGIEECYKRMKQAIQMEYFSGRTVHAILQDFYARIVMLNMSAMVATQSVSEKKPLGKKRNRYAKQINKVQVITKVKDFMVDIFYNGLIASSITKILKLLGNCYDIIRPNRQFKRDKGYKNKRKPLMYKGL